VLAPDFRKLIITILQRQAADVEWKSLVNDSNQTVVHFIRIMSSPRFWVICVADKDKDRKSAFKLLDAIKEAFESRYSLVEKRETLPPSQVQTQFVDEMRRLLHEFNDPNSDVIQRLKLKAEAARDLLQQNIEKINVRDEEIQRLHSSAGALLDQSVSFRRSADQLERGVWWKNVRVIVLIVVLILLVLFIFVWAVAHN